ncbi:MAG: four helix bundle protein [Anaerolineales bacterium]|nr:four helix bundle protein [Anaerolineales bacterium]
MATVNQFQDLRVWQSARELVNQIYVQTNKPPFAKDFALRDQIRKAAISVSSNIAEGFDAGYDSEFVRFLSYSFRSTAEVQSQLYIALDQGYIAQTEFDAVFSIAVDVRKKIRRLSAYLVEHKRVGLVARETSAAYIVAPELFELPDEFVSDQATS